MSQRGGGISGLGVALVAGGALLVYAAIHDTSPLTALRQIAGGQVPTDVPATPTAVQVDLGTDETSTDTTVSAGGTLNAAIAADVRRYLGVPYKIGGATPDGFDCSGLVTWVLHHDLGLNLPSNSHTVTSQWYVWSGATTVPREQCQAGDLVCWTGHIGIATGPTTFISAPTLGKTVSEKPIYWTPAPLIRRVKAQGATGSVSV